MPRTPKVYLNKTALLVTSRTTEGLPFSLPAIYQLLNLVNICSSIEWSIELAEPCGTKVCDTPVILDRAKALVTKLEI
jgi:hypothetical protein